MSRSLIIYRIEEVAMAAEISTEKGEGKLLHYLWLSGNAGEAYASVFIVDGVKTAYASKDMKNWSPCLAVVLNGERLTAREFIKKDDEIRRAHGKE